ncbi:YggS family pyridoxal phosphate-dependent enzyme [Halosquirtibacter xylanolyticus]|uniref:YggS family pyridoxal phosphate-dependent enzyme n=1 Tax=Halosquirtibacter xylanolyticus TaxID=3374599 RepID=UPI00374812AD|nr:YggS family pyridoxal phosphate-dependent enzyme [Prolixibacteraceae bacterium]
MSIKQNISTVIELLPKHVTLVAVSKTKPIELLEEAYNEGVRVFGENKVQELCHKQEILSKDIQWHMIGHLQTNKVKYIAPFVSLIHSVDSIKLLQTINKEALKNDRVIDVLLQMHIAEEDTKFGMSIFEVEDMLNSQIFLKLQNVRIVGLMGMATNTDSDIDIKNEFISLRRFFETLQRTFFKEKGYFNTLSMGMSSDYQLAIECGSTMVRIGSTLFGKRSN